MQKTRIKGKKFVQYLVKVNCETDFLVMLFLAVANGNVVRAVFCFRLFESALTQVCFKAYFAKIYCPEGKSQEGVSLLYHFRPFNFIPHI